MSAQAAHSANAQVTRKVMLHTSTAVAVPSVQKQLNDYLLLTHQFTAARGAALPAAALSSALCDAPTDAAPSTPCGPLGISSAASAASLSRLTSWSKGSI